MRWLVALVLLTLGGPLGAAATASAQESVLVVVVDPGETQINQRALFRAIGQSVDRTVVRMTDQRAPSASGRLTIAHSRPDRWVLRYEAHGQVAWVSDRIRQPGRIRPRLAELSAQVLARVDGEPGRRADWDDVIIALQDEIVDPFADDPPAPRERRPVTVLWSEVVDPFSDGSSHRSRQVWSEVLDPWAAEVRRRR